MTKSKEMKIVVRKIADLKPADYNPRELTPKQRQELTASLETFGLVDPILVNKNKNRKDIIIGGHQRVKVWQTLGNETVPTVELDLDLKQERELNVRLNKNTGQWNDEMLAQYFKKDELVDWGFEDDALNFMEEDIISEGQTDDDYAPEAPEEPESKPGDIWILGEHRLLVGDSTNPDDVKRLMDGAKADILYTDPPYGVSYKGTNFDIIKNDQLRDSELLNFLTKAFTNAHNYTKANPAIYVFYASKTHIEFEQALNYSGFEVKQQLIWQKGFNLGRSDYHWSHEPMLYAIKRGNNSKWYGDRTQQTSLTKQTNEYDKLKKADLVKILEALHEGQTVWQIKKDAASTYQHPTQKPVELALRALENSTKRGQNVLDLFTGSGSTMIACEKYGRKFYGMEFDPKYADVIKNRWQTFTGKKAIKK